MKKVFRSRIDWWLAALLILAFAFPLVTALINGENIILQLVVSLLILSVLRTVYVVNGCKLHVWVSFIPFGRKDIRKIVSVRRSSSLLSSPALSVDRLLITFRDGDILIVSPKDRDGFIAALLSVNPNIITDEKAYEMGDTAPVSVPKLSKVRHWSHVFWGLCLVVAAVQAIYTIAIYDFLPPRMATHFDLAGNPNGWMSRMAGVWGLYAFGVGGAFCCWLLRFLPASMISGMENVSKEEQIRSKRRLSFILSIISLFYLLLFCFVEYYIISKN